MFESIHPGNKTRVCLHCEWKLYLWVLTIYSRLAKEGKRRRTWRLGKYEWDRMSNFQRSKHRFPSPSLTMYDDDFLFWVLPTIPDLIIRGLSGQVTLFCIPVISRWREHFSGPSWDWITAIRMLWWWCWSSSRTPSTMWSVHLKPNSAGNIWTN